jgi:hypothetical protein
MMIDELRNDLKNNRIVFYADDVKALIQKIDNMNDLIKKVRYLAYVASECIDADDLIAASEEIEQIVYYIETQLD